MCVDYCLFFRLVSSRNNGADTLLNLLLELSSIQFCYFVLCDFVHDMYDLCNGFLFVCFLGTETLNGISVCSVTVVSGYLLRHTLLKNG